MLKIKDLNKIYPNGIQAFFNLNLEVNPGEFVVFVGPSGCGKSSILRTIAGLEEISTGNIYLDNTIINNATPWQRGVSMVFQNYALYPHYSVYKNIRFPLTNQYQELWYKYKNNINVFKKRKFIKFKYLGIAQETIHKINELQIQIEELKKEKKILKNSFVSKLLIIKANINSEKNLLNGKIKALGKKENKGEIEKLKNQFQNFKEKQKVEISKLKKDNDLEIKQNQKKILETKNNIKKITSKEISSINKKLSEQEKQKFKKEKEEFNKKHWIKKPYRLWKKENDEKVKWAANILQLSDYLYRKPRDLSGGQRQRVALGRSIVRNPKIFLLDEPLSNLDAKLRTTMRKTILDIHKRMEASTIYVTHDQVEAMTMASKIVVVNNGFVQQIGTPNEIYKSPSNMFVASFIGSPSMNFIKGEYKNKKFHSKEFTFIVNKTDQKSLEKYNGKKVILGIRPEDMSTSQIFIDTFKDTKVLMQVNSKEELGKEVIFYGNINNSQEEKIIILKNSEVIFKGERKLEIAINKNKISFFDPESKLSINHKLNKETIKALDIFEKNKHKSNLNKTLIEKEKNKQENKGLIKKVKKIIKNNIQKNKSREK